MGRLRPEVYAERDRKFSEGLHWCSRCKCYLPISAFAKQPKLMPFGLRPECKSCRLEADNAVDPAIRKQRSRNYYQKNRRDANTKNYIWRQNNKQHISDYMRNRHAEFKNQFVQLAGGACHRCGYCEFPTGLDFHHIDETAKTATPVSAISSGDFDRAYAELDKCILLCRNCHQSFHGRYWSASFTKRDGLGWTIA
jgi:hypothetical protein